LLDKREEIVLWYREFGILEIALIVLFAVTYVVYIVRIVSIGKRLNTPTGNVYKKLFLRSLYFALLIIALLGPSFGASKKEVKAIGKDIMICIDLSKSMDAFDIQPSRIEKVKFELKKLVQAFSSDRIGLIIFSSEAFMQCPLTYDQNALSLFIETMNTNLVPASGTNFGPPLQLALKKLNEKSSNTSTQPKSKVIILISDGEDFGEDTQNVVRAVEDQNIKLFTLGVGTTKGGNIATNRGLKTDTKGNVVTTKLNPKELRSLADKTGGVYFEINESQNDVNRLINTIQKIEGELRDAKVIDVTANKYFYFLLAAVILILIDVLYSIRTMRI
jgi:Ca-activated chloride channel family protein